MKRLVSAFLAGAMALSLAACGGAASTSTVASSAASGSAAASAAETAASDLDYIKEKGKMVIGYTVYEPMNYTDADGNFTGFDTELATAVCEKLGVEPEFVEINCYHQGLRQERTGRGREGRHRLQLHCRSGGKDRSG